MLVSDLSTLPGLRLVERDQLDALLAEVKLDETGFLDPATAQTLGKGVGARFVVTGSFTVLEPTFALDARIVEVQTGEIVKAAAAHGTVAEFVSVEKDLVEALVAGLDLTLSSADRRKLLMKAPTERFPAFAAYGEGLARKSEGKLDEAKSAFDRALAEDPQFTEAQAALGELEDFVKSREATQGAAEQTARDKAFTTVLAEVPDERTRAAAPPYDWDGLVAFALRLDVLEARQQDCDRYAEMRHYLERVHWNVAEPPPTGGIAFGTAVEALAHTKGLDAGDADPLLPKHLQVPLARLSAGLFHSTDTFVFNPTTEPAHGLLTSLVACYAPAEALGEIDALVTAARAAGVADTLGKRPLPLPLDDRLQVWWLRTRARTLGADAELTKRAEALITRNAKDPVRARVVKQVVDGVIADAHAAEEHRVRRRGAEPDVIVRRMRLLAEGKVAETPACKPGLNARIGANAWVGLYDRNAGNPVAYERSLDDALVQWAPAADFGCLQGTSPRFATSADAWDWFDAARRRALTGAPAQCDVTWAQYEQVLAATREQRLDPNIGDVWLYPVDQAWMGLVYGGCAHE
jgi:tetratricopeptide (TPR) repeat protein